MPLLDLTEREGGFDALPSGKYRATIVESEETETSGKGKLPAGTPMINLRWKIEEPLFDYPATLDNYNDQQELVEMEAPAWENRQVFSSHVIPDKDMKNYKMMNGMLFRMLEAIGYTKEELASGTFELDYEDMKGREAIITLSRYTYTDPDTEDKTFQNNVKGVKPVGTHASSGII